MTETALKNEVTAKKWRALVRISNEASDSEIENKKRSIKHSMLTLLSILVAAIVPYLFISPSEYGVVAGHLSIGILFPICFIAFYLKSLSGSYWSIVFMALPFLVFIAIKAIPPNHADKIISLFGIVFSSLLCLIALIMIISNIKFAKQIKCLGSNEADRLLSLIKESPYFSDNEKNELFACVKERGNLDDDAKKYALSKIFGAT